MGSLALGVIAHRESWPPCLPSLARLPGPGYIRLLTTATPQVPENELCRGLGSVQARVQRSLERLDLPPWYTQRSPCSSPSSPTPPPYPSLGRGREGSVSSPSPSLRWREGCASPQSSRWRDSSLPPPAPIRTPTPRSRPPPSPSSPPPYLGWRSQEKLPSFLPTQPRNRVGSVPRSQVQEYSL